MTLIPGQRFSQMQRLFEDGDIQGRVNLYRIFTLITLAVILLESTNTNEITITEIFQIYWD